MSNAEYAPTATDRPQLRVAGVVKALMEDAGETQDELGAAIGLNSSSLSRALDGKRKMSVDELAAIAEHYDVGYNAFFQGIGSLIRTGRFATRLTLVNGHNDGTEPAEDAGGQAVRPNLTLVTS